MTMDDHALCDHVVRIPMTGSVDSLNLGVAGSLMLYESLRSRSGTAFQGLPQVREGPNLLDPGLSCPAVSRAGTTSSRATDKEPPCRQTNGSR